MSLHCNREIGPDFDDVLYEWLAWQQLSAKPSQPASLLTDRSQTRAGTLLMSFGLMTDKYSRYLMGKPEPQSGTHTHTHTQPKLN